MREWHKHSDPADFEQWMDDCAKAYKKICDRWEDYDPAYSAVDCNLQYARSAQMWHDCEEGSKLLTLEDFQMAEEYREYMSNMDSAAEHAYYASCDLCHYAGYAG